MIRAASELDADCIALHRYPDEVGERPVYAAWAAGAILRGVYLGWLAEEAGQVFSGAGLVLLDWGPTRGQPNPLRARLVNVYTDPAHRRRGPARDQDRYAGGVGSGSGTVPGAELSGEGERDVAEDAGARLTIKAIDAKMSVFFR